MPNWAHGSVVERVPDKNEVLGSIPSAPTHASLLLRFLCSPINLTARSEYSATNRDFLPRGKKTYDADDNTDISYMRASLFGSWSLSFFHSFLKQRVQNSFYERSALQMHQRRLLLLSVISFLILFLLP